MARRPRGIVLSPDFKELFVAAGDGDIMDVIDTQTFESTPARIRPGSGADGRRSQGRGHLHRQRGRFSSPSWTSRPARLLAEVPVGVEPEGMTVSPDGKYTVATSESTSMAHVIDNATRKLIANVLVDLARARPSSPPTARSFGSPRGRRHHLGDRSRHLEGDQGDRLRGPGVRPELLQPVGMDFSKDGKLLFSPLGPANRVAVIDTATKEVKDYILVGQRPWHGELSPDGKKYYVANGLTNDMTVIDVDSLKAEKSVPVGVCPGAWPSCRKARSVTRRRHGFASARARRRPQRRGSRRA